MIEFVHEDFERVITIFYMYKKVDLSMLSRDMKNIKTASIKFLEIKKVLLLQLKIQWMVLTLNNAVENISEFEDIEIVINQS